MRLDAVRVVGYRSAQDVLLPALGNFNVLIGKNNSGKSTLLASIQAFFRSIASGGVVSTIPILGRRVDFSNASPEGPIRITPTLSLQLAERDALMRDIASDAPQMKNAVDGLDPSLKLEVTVAFPKAKRLHSYIESIYLVDRTSGVSKTLLGIDNAAAAELVAKFQTSDEARDVTDQIKRILSTIDADDFRRMTGREQSFPLAFYLRRFDANTLTSNLFEGALKNSTSFAEFQSNVAAERDKYLAETKRSTQTPLKNKIQTFAGEEDHVPQYITNLLGRLAELSVLYLTEQRAPVGKAEAEKLLSFKVKRGGNEALRNIQETVDGLLGVQVDAFESTAAIEKRAEMDVDNFLLEVNGSGIREALRLILDVEFQHPVVLLVEEPEVHLHPALETNMMRYLKRVSAICQIFISTHSTNFLDTAEMKNVYLISKQNGFTEVEAVDFQEAESKIPKELGLRLSSVFMFDRLVFVEGPTDEATFREWASTLNLNLIQANVGFVSMGGVRNFAHYATEAILTLLTRRRVGMWFVIDRDERDNTEVAQLEERLREKAKVEVLGKRELENYLLVPRAIVDFILMKQSLIKAENKTPDERTVTQAMSECADELKEFAIAKHVSKSVCKPIYPSSIFQPEGFKGGVVTALSGELERLRQELDSKARSLKELVEQHTRNIEANWDREKMNIVPGDLLLDKVCKRFGVRFKKEVDSARLAAMMKENEIDHSMVNILREMAH